MATKTKKAKSSDWRELDQEELIEKIVEAREEQGLPWAEIREMSGGMSLGKLMFLRDVGTVEEKDRIKYRSEEDLPEKFEEARKNNLSWGIIAARVGLPPGRVRKIYEDHFGEGSSKLEGGQERVKGRRGVVAEKPDPEDKPKKAAKAKSKKAPAKKSSKSKAPAKKKAGGSFGGVKPLAEMDTEELAERLDGKTITVKQGSKNVRIGVKSVKETDGEEVEFTDNKGKARTVKISAITKASR